MRQIIYGVHYATVPPEQAFLHSVNLRRIFFNGTPFFHRLFRRTLSVTLQDELLKFLSLTRMLYWPQVHWLKLMAVMVGSINQARRVPDFTRSSIFNSNFPPFISLAMKKFINRTFTKRRKWFSSSWQKNPKVDHPRFRYGSFGNASSTSPNSIAAGSKPFLMAESLCKCKARRVEDASRSFSCVVRWHTRYDHQAACTRRV